MTSTRHIAWLLALLLLLLGCSTNQAAVDPVWGKQPCDHCHMLLSDPGTAAQLLSVDGERLYFDDVGCLVERIARDASSVGRIWVRDARGVWIDARRARYRTGARTPMGYGVQVSADGDLDFAAVQRELAHTPYAEQTP